MRVTNLQRYTRRKGRMFFSMYFDGKPVKVSYYLGAIRFIEYSKDYTEKEIDCMRHHIKEFLRENYQKYLGSYMTIDNDMDEQYVIIEASSTESAKIQLESYLGNNRIQVTMLGITPISTIQKI
jgi:hypothetical protein